MIELERIVREVAAWKPPYLLATVVGVQGSSYRRPGARMLVARDRWISGCISGGCLEGDVLMKGAYRCSGGPVVITYDSSRDIGEPWGVGLGCGGVVDLLLERVDAGPNDALAFAAACFEHETTGMLATVIRSDRGDVPVGSRLAVGPNVAMVRPIGDRDIKRTLVAACHGPPDVVEASGVTALIELIAPSPQLFVLGSSHDAAPLVPLARSLGFRVTVADAAIRERSRFLSADRVVATDGDVARVRALIDAAYDPYVVIMHHAPAADAAAIEMALGSRARYVGALGPARRTRELLAPGRANDPRLHAPIGLDIGAETPEQIAVAIAAELQSVARGARGGRLRDRARSLHADIATVVLAAGKSMRLGRPKQLVEIGGVPLVRRVAESCLDARLGPVGVVLGAHAGAVTGALGDLHVARITNPGWPEGIASSVRAAARWAATTPAGALLVMLVDQPEVERGHLAALRDAWLAGAPIAASRYADTLGAPAIFDRSRWGALGALDGDRGAGVLLRDPDVVGIDCPAAAVDLDTPADLEVLATRNCSIRT